MLSAAPFTGARAAGELQKGLIGACLAKVGGAAVPVGGQFAAAGSTGAVFEEFAEFEGGGGMPATGGTFKATGGAWGVFRAADAAEVTLPEPIEGIDVSGPCCDVKELDGALVVAFDAPTAHEAQGKMHAGSGIIGSGVMFGLLGAFGGDGGHEGLGCGCRLG